MGISVTQQEKRANIRAALEMVNDALVLLEEVHDHNPYLGDSITAMANIVGDMAEYCCIELD